MLATGVLLFLTALGIGRKITWYLAVDQYGYLTFAHDLMHGRVFHHWPPLDALAARIPDKVDVLVQTYVYDKGILYCRYAPGFPMLLAAWLTVFGDDGAAYLNPTVFIALLVLALAFQARVFRSRWRATAGIALVVLFPTQLHLWSLTLVRELPTHLFGLLGLYLLLPSGTRRLGPRRMAAAGAALGFAGTIRPENLIYCAPAALLAIARFRRERTAVRPMLSAIGGAVLGTLVGLTPFFGYNWAATGSPFRPTQGMEVQNFLPSAQAEPMGTAIARVGFPPGAWRGGTAFQVQGGALRLANLPIVLPGNIALLRDAYGDLLLWLAIWGAVLAAIQRRMLFLAAVPYVILALLFYSCWSKPDARYQSGIYVMLPMLVVEGAVGTLDAVRRLRRLWSEITARWVALGFAAVMLGGSMLISEPTARGALPTLLVIVPLVAGVSALAAATWPERRIAGIAAPVLALALVVLAGSRASASLETRATFQRPEMLRSRAIFARAVEPGAVVMTTEEVGRPAENIDYYSGIAHAFYFTDLARWRITVPDAAELLARHHMRPYLLIPNSQPTRAEMLEQLRARFSVELVADIPPASAIDYFVAAPFHRGIHMELYRIVWQPKAVKHLLDPPNAGH